MERFAKAPDKPMPPSTVNWANPGEASSATRTGDKSETGAEQGFTKKLKGRVMGAPGKFFGKIKNRAGDASSSVDGSSSGVKGIQPGSDAGPSREREPFANHDKLNELAQDPGIQAHVEGQMNYILEKEMGFIFPTYRNKAESLARQEIRRKYVDAERAVVTSHSIKEYLQGLDPEKVDGLEIPIGASPEMSSILAQKIKELTTEKGRLFEEYRRTP